MVAALAGAILPLGASSARAQALLKPVGAASQDLQPRAIDVRAQIDGAWAQTSVTTVYANANTAPIEADFLYAAPPGAVITGFAYWYGREKVVAQITEKERAAAIYTLAKSANNDPALVEMSGKNVFRARIAQVLPKYNLRVEVKFAQPLAFQKGAPTWSYPLLADTRDVTLDWLRVRTEVKNAPGALNNFDASLKDGAFTFRKYNFKPGFDPRVTLAAPKSPLQAHLVTQHRGDSGKADEGYFALSVRGADGIGDSKTLPKIAGVATFDLLAPQRVGSDEIRLFGRYRGAGAATISWGKAKAVVNFKAAKDAASEVDGLAASLWGAGKIEALGTKNEARAQIVALSTRFDVPSKWTSWVAMPNAQRVAMRNQLRQLDMQRRGAELGRTFAIELENGRPFSAVSLHARGDLRALARSGVGRKFGFDEENARANAIQKRLAELGHDAMAAQMGVAPKNGADVRLTRLAGVAGSDKTPYLVRAQKGLRDLQVKTVAAKWTSEVVALRENTPVARRLKTQLETLRDRYGVEEDFENAAYHQTAGQMALATLNEALAGRENGLRAAKFIDAGERYARKCGQNSFQKDFYAPTIQTNLSEANRQIVHEIEAGRDQSEDAKDAQVRVHQLFALAPELRGDFRAQGSQEWEIDRAKRGLAHEVAYRLVQTKTEHPGEKAEQIALEAQLERLSDQTEADGDDILAEETARYKNHEPLLNARQFQQQGEVAKDDPTPLALPAEEAATPIPTPDAGEQEWTAPGSDAAAPSQYQVRPGDPLISLAAPRDAQQVVAILPDGTFKKLEWNAVTSRWETRFDVPTYAPDGGYEVQILLVRRDGTRAHFQMRFDVDTAAPRARALKSASGKANGATWNLRLQTEAGTERVSALTPWNERVKLQNRGGGMWSRPIAVPTQWQGKSARVRFIVIDSAHNRTEVLVDWN